MHGAKALAAVTIPRKPAAPLASFVGKLVLVPTDLVDPMPNQPRTHFDRTLLDALKTSIASVGQQEAGTIVPWTSGRFQLRDGERRFRCCKDLGIDFLANVAPASPTLDEEFELAGIANFLRAGHTPLEKARYIRRLQGPPLKRSVAQIASSMGVTVATIYNYLLLLDKLSEGAQRCLDANRVRRPLQFSVAIELTSLSAHPDVQTHIARKVVEGGLTMQAAKRLIHHEAERLGVHTGRGRERVPSDQLANMRTAIRRFGESLESFLAMSQEDFDAMFTHIPAGEHTTVLDAVRERQRLLSRLERRLANVSGAGSKRGGTQLHAVS